MTPLQRMLFDETKARLCPKGPDAWWLDIEDELITQLPPDAIINQLGIYRLAEIMIAVACNIDSDIV